MSDKLRDQITELIRDEIQDVINDYVDAQEETKKAGLGFVGKEDEKELKVNIRSFSRHLRPQRDERTRSVSAYLRPIIKVSHCSSGTFTLK